MQVGKISFAGPCTPHFGGLLCFYVFEIHDFLRSHIMVSWAFGIEDPTELGWLVRLWDRRSHRAGLFFSMDLH